MSCSFTIIISCMVFFFLLKLCFLCAANSLNILSALFPPPFLLPPHPLHTHWNQGLLGWVLCCTGEIFFFFFFFLSLSSLSLLGCVLSLFSLSLLGCVCVCVCVCVWVLNRMQGICDSWLVVIDSALSLRVEMGGVLVRFHLMNLLPHSGVWTIFIVVMRLCVLHTGKGQKEAFWELFTVLFATVMVLLKSFLFFFSSSSLFVFLWELKLKSSCS